MDRLRWLPFATFAALALAVVPITSRMALTVQGCEILPTSTQLMAAPLNLRHVLSYCVLFLLAAAAFRSHPLQKAALLTFALSLAIELEQALVASGHCRAWDLIPNVIGIASGALLYLGLTALWRRARS